MQAIESGAADRQNNLLKNAPHTADMVVADNWTGVPARVGGVPGQIIARLQVLAGGRARGQRFWRPQPDLLVHRDGHLRFLM